MRSAILALTFAFFAFFASGCATILSPADNQAMFQTPDHGDRVTINGVPYGQTPLMVTLDNTEPVLVSVECADGTLDVRQYTPRVRGGFVVLDFIFTGFLGIAVDAISGEWSRLPIDDVTMFCAGGSAPTEPEIEVTHDEEDIPSEQLRVGGRR